MKNAFQRLLPVIFLFGALSAQTFQASVTGNVRDQSGAVIPNVQVTAIEVANGTKYSAATNESGIYRFPALPPAQYKFSAALQGFKTFEQGPITLQVQQALELNITLEPGQVSERVTVTAAPPPLETESATVGQVVTTRSILSLPLNIRDPIALIGLTPGVTFGATSATAAATTSAATSSSPISTSAADAPARRKS